MPLTSDLREQLLGTVREWGSGRDTLRCLAMATRDSPPDPRTLNLENSSAFSEYEVSVAQQRALCRNFYELLKLVLALILAYFQNVLYTCNVFVPA